MSGAVSLGGGAQLEVVASICGGGFSTFETMVDIDDLIPEDVMQTILERVITRVNEAYAAKVALRGSPPEALDARLNKPSNLYLMRSRNLHKIGVSCDVSSRRAQLSCASGQEVELVMHWPMPAGVAFQTERYLHATFERKRGIGEWFRLGKRDIEFIINRANEVTR